MVSCYLFSSQSLTCYIKSSRHNIMLIPFPLVFVLWSVLAPSKAFSCLRHSCSKKVQWSLFHVSLSKFTINVYNMDFCSSTYTFFEQLWCKQEKALLRVNRLHNTKTRGKGIKIIFWRLLKVRKKYIQDKHQYFQRSCE